MKIPGAIFGKRLAEPGSLFTKTGSTYNPFEPG
jgi:hypothetical protein